MRSINLCRVGLISLVILLAGSALTTSASAQVAVGISVGFAPPELPVYEQPLCPGEGYIWTPGFWDWDPDDQDYYWVPGTWVLAPQPGYLWTPGYWGWGDRGFIFYAGYWGPVVGFYGGINYGYGYFGRGYEGGRWEGAHFYYNRAVNNVNVTIIHNVYETRVTNVNVTRVSYNGGNGGLNVRPTPQEERAVHERHLSAVPAQTQHIQEARSNRELRASENHGKPPIAATEKPGAFRGGGVVAAREGGHYNPPPDRGANNADRPTNDRRSVNEANRPSNNPNRPPSASNRPENNNHRAQPNDRPNYSHANQLPPHTASENSSGDAKYQQQQQKLIQKQQQEHQKLQQRQEQEHEKVAQQHAPAAKQQQMEQKHQQQTQQMEQKHQQQQQKMEQRQQPRPQAAPHPNQEKKPH